MASASQIRVGWRSGRGPTIIGDASSSGSPSWPSATSNSLWAARAASKSAFGKPRRRPFAAPAHGFLLRRLAVVADRRRGHLRVRIVEGVEVERRVGAAVELGDGADINPATSAEQEIGGAGAEAIA